MTTYNNDINTFDWSVVNDQLQARSMIKQEVQLNTEDIWFDKFMDTAQQLPSTTTTTATGSPLEFSLFDINDQQPSEPQSLFNSTVTSLTNSPMIKPEDLIPDLPSLDLNTASRSQSTSSIDSGDSDSNTNSPQTPTTAVTSTTTQQTFNCNAVAAENPIAASSTTTTEKKPKKKRAPRKRLTPHQKQAHNKIEKRYRININAKIAGLQQIIPWVASEKTAFETGDGTKPQDPEADVPRLNKSMILEKATSYILYLQESEDKMKIQVEKLRKEVERLGGNPNEI